MIIKRETVYNLTYLCPNCYNQINMNVNQNYEIELFIPKYIVEGMIASNITTPGNPEVSCPYCGCEMIDVDSKISHAVMKLWKAGFKTATSCEGHLNQGRCYAIFENDNIMTVYKDPQQTDFRVIGTIGPYIDILVSDEVRKSVIPILNILSKPNYQYKEVPNAGKIQLKSCSCTLFYYEWERENRHGEVEHLIRIATFGDIFDYSMFNDFTHGVRLYVVKDEIPHDNEDQNLILNNPLLSNAFDQCYYDTAKNLLSSAQSNMTTLVSEFIHIISTPSVYDAIIK